LRPLRAAIASINSARKHYFTGAVASWKDQDITMQPFTPFTIHSLEWEPILSSDRRTLIYVYKEKDAKLLSWRHIIDKS